MVQQTAMQQLIKWMEDMSEVIPFDQGSCYDKAIELLQMEKEQIIKTANDVDNSDFWVKYESFEQYYNETYENK